MNSNVTLSEPDDGKSLLELENSEIESFYQRLNKLHNSSGLNLLFDLRQTTLDLLLFYKEVLERGGFIYSVADVLLWRNTSVSAALLIGMTAVIWFIFGVVEYNWVILLCHLSITTLLIIFILQFVKFWVGVALISAFIIPPFPFRRNVRPDDDLTLKEFTSELFNYFDSAFGRDLPFFLFAIIFLYMLPVIGTYLSFLNLLYLGFIYLGILPLLFERFEEDVTRLGVKIAREKQS